MKLPRITGEGRGWIIVRLSACGTLHALAAFSLSRWAHQAIANDTSPGQNWTLLLGIVSMSFVIYALRVLQARDAASLGQDYVMQVRFRLLKASIGSRWNPGSMEAWGVTMNRMVTDLNSLRNWVSFGLARIVSSGLAIAGLLSALAWFAPYAATSMLAAAALPILVSVLVVPSLREQIRNARRFRGRLARKVGEDIRSAPTMKLLGTARRRIRAVENVSRRLKRASVTRSVFSAALRRSPELAYGPAIAVLLIQASTGGTDGGQLSSILLIGFVVSAMRDLFQAWDYRLAYLEGRRRLATLLQSSPVSNSRGGTKWVSGKGPVSLTFDSVLSSPGAEVTSFKVEAGSRTLLAGRSGSGKTTLLKIASGLVAPHAGKLLIDGLSVTQISSLHRIVHFLSPELPLIRGTVGDNLRAAYHRAKETSVLSAARISGILDDPAQFREGLDTRVAEAGANLSSGALARVLLARAVVARPRLLLIDESSMVAREDMIEVLKAVLDHLQSTVVFAAVGAPSNLRFDQTIRVIAFRPAQMHQPHIQGDPNHDEPSLDTRSRSDAGRSNGLENPDTDGANIVPGPQFKGVCRN